MTFEDTGAVDSSDEDIDDTRPTAARGAVSTTLSSLGTVWLGYVAFGIALVLAIIEGVAIFLASSRQPAIATTVGQILVVVTALPLALGLMVALRGPQRAWGIAAIVLAVVANPLVLLNVLSFFGSL
ncbi:MAG: hypothetical protein KF801_03800 [Cryobacterium sp.]|nr:hypothetical protein [Cryobacterium sp.]